MGDRVTRDRTLDLPHPLDLAAVTGEILGALDAAGIAAEDRRITVDQDRRRIAVDVRTWRPAEFIEVTISKAAP